jgi:DNA polymerase I-like protein with 3'-5' exonuclease and polymerase domains
MPSPFSPFGPIRGKRAKAKTEAKQLVTKAKAAVPKRDRKPSPRAANKEDGRGHHELPKAGVWTPDDVFGSIRPKKALEEPPTKNILVTTLEEVDAALDECTAAGLMVFDFETTGLDHHSDFIVSVQVTCRTGMGYYIPMGHRNYEHNLDTEEVLSRLAKVMADPDVRIIAHSLKFDFKWLIRHGFEELTNPWDTLIAAHVTNETRPSYSLKKLTATHLGYDMTTFGSLNIHLKDGPCPEGKYPDFSYVPLEKAMDYACADVDMTLRLYEYLVDLIDNEYSTIFYDIEMPLVAVLASMEFEGVEMDPEYMSLLGVELKKEIDKLYNYLNDTVRSMDVVNRPERDTSWDDDGGPPPIWDPMGVDTAVAEGFSKVSALPGATTPKQQEDGDASNDPFEVVLEEMNRNNFYKRLTPEGYRKKRASYIEEFNWGSPAHLLKLFKVLDIDTGRLTPSSRKRGSTTKTMSTDKKALQGMARNANHAGHKIAKALLGYRQLTKIYTAFCETLPTKVHPKTGRIHPNFNQARTVTARLSCSDPNLQQIPKSGVCAVRYPFKPKEGCVFLQCDYSQVELRILAHLAGDEGMIKAFKDGLDIHSLTAYECFVGKGIPEGTSLEDVKKHYSSFRTAAKTISFGIVYGMGAKALAETLGITEKKAKEYIDSYLDGKPKVKEYMVLRQREMWNKNYVETPLGRRRHMAPNPKTGRWPFGWERKAINFPIQSASAEILKYVMRRLYDRLKAEKFPAKLLLQIHDELIIECREDFVETVLPVIKEIFEEAIEGLGVKFAVPLEADPAVQYRWAIEVDKCEDCGSWAVAPDGGMDLVDMGGGVTKPVKTKSCLACTPTNTPGMWDLEDTIKNIEARALTEDE